MTKEEQEETKRYLIVINAILNCILVGIIITMVWLGRLDLAILILTIKSTMRDF